MRESIESIGQLLEKCENSTAPIGTNSTISLETGTINEDDEEVTYVSKDRTFYTAQERPLPLRTAKTYSVLTVTDADETGAVQNVTNEPRRPINTETYTVLKVDQDKGSSDVSNKKAQLPDKVSITASSSTYHSTKASFSSYSSVKSKPSSEERMFGDTDSNLTRKSSESGQKAMQFPVPEPSKSETPLYVSTRYLQQQPNQALESDQVRAPIRSILKRETNVCRQRVNISVPDVRFSPGTCSNTSDKAVGRVPQLVDRGSQPSSYYHGLDMTSTHYHCSGTAVCELDINVRQVTGDPWLICRPVGVKREGISTCSEDDDSRPPGTPKLPPLRRNQVSLKALLHVSVLTLD